MLERNPTWIVLMSGMVTDMMFVKGTMSEGLSWFEKLSPLLDYHGISEW